MRGRRGELRTGRQQRREVVDAVDFELREDAIQKARVGNRSGELAAHERRQRRVEQVDVERDDGDVEAGESRQQRVADFTAGTGDEDDRLADHDEAFPWPSLASNRSGTSASAPQVSGSWQTSVFKYSETSPGGKRFTRSAAAGPTFSRSAATASPWISPFSCAMPRLSRNAPIIGRCSARWYATSRRAAI